VTENRYLDAAEWYDQLPTVYLAAAAVITNPGGRILLVKPNYRNHWNLPGGICEHGEDPYAGCVREVREEIGLDLPIGPLLVADWVAPAGPRPRPIISMIFDGGTLASADGITLQYEELDDYLFTAPEDVGNYLPASVAPRVPAALAARGSGGASYLPRRQADLAGGAAGQDLLA
jgi:ADP-ribose pyrophosphatase YjhB (NUDIX family)